MLPAAGGRRDDGFVARLRQIVVDARHPGRRSIARFGKQALDGFRIRPYDPAEIARLAGQGLTPESDPVVILDGPDLELCFQQVEPLRPLGEKRPSHLDLRTGDRETDVERLVGLGATVVERFESHTWLRDPEGNDRCRVDER